AAREHTCWCWGRVARKLKGGGKLRACTHYFASTVQSSQAETNAARARTAPCSVCSVVSLLLRPVGLNASSRLSLIHCVCSAAQHIAVGCVEVRNTACYTRERE